MATKPLTTPEDFETLRQLPVGTKIALGNGGDSYYFGTIEKVNPKTVSVKNPDAGSYKDALVVFRCAAPYTGAQPRIQKFGGESYVNWTPYLLDDEMTVAVDASYAARAARAQEKRAAAKAADVERQERRARDKAAALAANPNPGWTKFGILGGCVDYYSGKVFRYGHECMVVLAVKQINKREWGYRDNAFAEWTERIFSGAVNYEEFDEYQGEENHEPGSMGSCSPNVTGKTMDELFAEAIFYVAR